MILYFFIEPVEVIEVRCHNEAGCNCNFLKTYLISLLYEEGGSPFLLNYLRNKFNNKDYLINSVENVNDSNLEGI